MNEKEKQIEADVFAQAVIQSLLVGNDYATALVARGTERADHKEKQIEEMEKVIAEAFMADYNIGCDPCTGTVATALYLEGYRKQSVGEWEKVMNHRECSRCHYRAPYKKIKAGYHLQDLTRYCPNCGARMGGGAE